MVYFIVIAAANIALSLLDTLRGGRFFPSLGNCVWATAAVIAVDGVFAFAIRRLPARWFDERSRLCRVSGREQRLLRKMRVRLWERYIPEWGGFTNFHKNKLAEPNNPDYLRRFLLETNYGAVIHLSNALTGVLILPIPFTGSLLIRWGVITVNAVLSLLPFIVLRHNTAPLVRLLRRHLR